MWNKNNKEHNTVPFEMLNSTSANIEKITTYYDMLFPIVCAFLTSSLTHNLCLSKLYRVDLKCKWLIISIVLTRLWRVAIVALVRHDQGTGARNYQRQQECREVKVDLVLSVGCRVKSISRVPVQLGVVSRGSRLSPAYPVITLRGGTSGWRSSWGGTNSCIFGGSDRQWCCILETTLKEKHPIVIQ